MVAAFALAAVLSAAPDAPLRMAALVPEAPPEPAGRKLEGWERVHQRAAYVGAFGATFLVGGATLWVISQYQYQRAVHDLSQGRIDSAVHNNIGGMALMGVGLCAVGVAAVMANAGPGPAPAKPKVVLLPAAGGGGAYVSGVWW